jgi:hypothetical protein
LGLCCALLHWSPAIFFSSTPHEIFAAIEGVETINRPSDETSK